MEHPNLAANLYLNADLENRRYSVRSQINTPSKRIAFCLIASGMLLIIYIGIVHTLRLILLFLNNN
jgi:hypothetical protein